MSPKIKYAKIEKYKIVKLALVIYNNSNYYQNNK